MFPAFEATMTCVPDPAQVLGADSRARLAARCMRLLLGPQSGISPEALDRSTGLFNRAGLFAAANMELGQRFWGGPASAILLEFPDLQEVRQIYGSTIVRKVVQKLVRRLRKIAGRRGLVGRTGPAQFMIVFAGMGGAKAAQRFERGLGHPARIEFDAGESELVLVPGFVIDSFEPGTDSVQDLYREMVHDLARSRKDERRRLQYITSERERHSRPMSVRL